MLCVCVCLFRFLNRFVLFGSGISTVHAIFISAMSLYFVFWSDLFSDRWHNDLVVFRSSRLSSLGLGVSTHFSGSKNVNVKVYERRISTLLH